eukprot:GCRY01003074.1.p1 GENE.GCRY01003074.1~~GCRY01003074.1.p1  ORF type:complete len:311 (-),score=1.91 GCRY01003074.1:334-1266(-)
MEENPDHPNEIEQKTDMGKENEEELTPEHRHMHQVIFLTLILVLIIAQFFLYLWKMRAYKSFQNTTLLGLWVLPLLFSLSLGYWRFLIVWIIISFIDGYTLYLATRKPLAPTTPGFVYSWLSGSYKAAYSCALLGYILLLSDFFGISLMFGLTGTSSISYNGFLLLFYGCYFGVLGRDFAEMCTFRLAATMGYYQEEGLPARRLNPTICCLCDKELHDDSNDTPQKTVQFNCKHSFHEFCARGWAVIGKKNICPYCREKVDMKSVFPAGNPWEKQTALWASVLDALRYLLVWNPLIIILTTSVFKYFGYH